MQTRKLGFTDLNLTVVGLGTWAMGGGSWQWSWGPQDDAESMQTVRLALDLGINWVDTAAAYGLGHSEEVVGRAIGRRRREVILATKCWLVWDKDSPNLYGRLRAVSIRRECEASLRRLGADVIDLYQLHWPNPDPDLEEAWGAMADLIREGKVRYAGVSNCGISHLKRLQPIHPVTSVQPPYSMLGRAVEADLLPYCAAHNIGVIGYNPLQMGLLAGKLTRERIAALPEDDWRRDHSSDFQEPALSANLALVEGLQPITRRHGRSLADLAIAWVLRRPEVTAAIVGARSPWQIEEVAKAGDWRLTAQELAEIETLLARRAQTVA